MGVHEVQGLFPSNRHLAVVDVETTGVGKRDRVVELAVVLLNCNGNVVDEYDTLINPERDIGPTDVHGITASMVSAAPTFAQVAGAVASRLHDAVLVAHNLAYDSRMLVNEFARLDAQFDAGFGVCTLCLAGERLNTACQRFNIPMAAQHRALVDARATAELLKLVLAEPPESRPVTVIGIAPSPDSRTLRREATDNYRSSPLVRVVSAMRYPTSDASVLSYLDALDWVLDDLLITQTEAKHLSELAYDMGLSADQVQSINRRYVDLLVDRALRDGIVTTHEHKLIDTVARVLNVQVVIPAVTDLPKAPAGLSPGARVCFTGTAIGQDGQKIDRVTLEATAAAAGLQPVASVSKKNCDLLVAADTSSSSGKAAKARHFGVPVISVKEFCDLIGMPG